MPDYLRPPEGSELLKDTVTWMKRFTVPSDSTSEDYVIGQHRKRHYWGCSCKGWKNNRTCKHLLRLGLPGHECPFEISFEGQPIQMGLLPSPTPIPGCWRRKTRGSKTLELKEEIGNE